MKTGRQQYSERVGSPWYRRPELLIGLAGLAIAAVAYVEQRASAPTAEERVAECERSRGAPARTEVAKGNERAWNEASVTWLYGNCAWPPIVPENDDGYYEVIVNHVPLPGTSGGDEFTEIDVVDGPCDRFTVQYFFENMGLAEEQPPWTLARGRTISVNDGESVNVVPYESTLPSNYHEFVNVLSHFRYDLTAAKCAGRT